MGEGKRSLLSSCLGTYNPDRVAVCHLSSRHKRKVRPLRIAMGECIPSLGFPSANDPTPSVPRGLDCMF